MQPAKKRITIITPEKAGPEPMKTGVAEPFPSPLKNSKSRGPPFRSNMKHAAIAYHIYFSVACEGPK